MDSLWKVYNLDLIYTMCSLEEANKKIDPMLKEKITGRIVIDFDR